MAGKTANYRGPSSGYSSGAKAQYRSDVWESFTDFAKATIRSVSDAYAIILPSKDGEEIEVAIQYGVPEEKIICVDENPALIAASQWRKKFPRCKYYGCKISQLPEKLEEDGRRVAIANLDLCNNFSEDLLDEIQSFFKTPRYEGFNVSITVSKGRENKAVTALLGMVAGSLPLQEKRLSALVRGSFPNSREMMLTGEGTYTHNRTPMAWASFSAIPKKEIEDRCKPYLSVLRKWGRCQKALSSMEMEAKRKEWNIRSRKHKVKQPWRLERKAQKVWSDYLERQRGVWGKCGDAEYAIAQVIEKYQPIDLATSVSFYPWDSFLPSKSATIVENGPSRWKGIKM